jgi:hypothetical protein
MPTGRRANPDLNRETLLWLAGLLEGEGSFLRGAPSTPNVPRISVQMVDEDVIARVAEAFDTSYQSIPPQREGHQRSYKTVLRGTSAVLLMREIRSLMGRRRQAQIDAAVSSWVPHRGRPSAGVEEQLAVLLVEGRLSYRAIGRKLGVSHTLVGERAKGMGL